MTSLPPNDALYTAVWNPEKDDPEDGKRLRRSRAEAEAGLRLQVAFESFRRLEPRTTARGSALRFDAQETTDALDRSDSELVGELRRLILTLETYRRLYPGVTDIFKNVENSVRAVVDPCFLASPDVPGGHYAGMNATFESHVRAAMNHYKDVTPGYRGPSVQLYESRPGPSRYQDLVGPRSPRA